MNSYNATLDNIKSKIIIKRIFFLLHKKQFLRVIRYNNKLKNILNINLNDYKKCYEIVEIEITFAENKYGQFINIVNPVEKDNFHIYFDDSNEEINRTYVNEGENVYKINNRKWCKII